MVEHNKTQAVMEQLEQAYMKVAQLSNKLAKANSELAIQTAKQEYYRKMAVENAKRIETLFDVSLSKETDTDEDLIRNVIDFLDIRILKKGISDE